MQLLKAGPLAGPCEKGNEISDPKRRRGGRIYCLAQRITACRSSCSPSEIQHTVNIQQGATAGGLLQTKEGSRRTPQLVVFIK